MQAFLDDVPSAVRVGRENPALWKMMHSNVRYLHGGPMKTRKKTVFRLLVADMDASQEESIKLLLERASSPNKYYLKGKLNGLVM